MNPKDEYGQGQTTSEKARREGDGTKYVMPTKRCLSNEPKGIITIREYVRLHVPVRNSCFYKY